METNHTSKAPFYAIALKSKSSIVFTTNYPESENVIHLPEAKMTFVLDGSLTLDRKAIGEYLRSIEANAALNHIIRQVQLLLKDDQAVRVLTIKEHRAYSCIIHTLGQSLIHPVNSIWHTGSLKPVMDFYARTRSTLLSTASMSKTELTAFASGLIDLQTRCQDLTDAHE